MLIALTLPFALWALRESRGRLRVVAVGGRAAARRLARRVRLARRGRRRVRRAASSTCSRSRRTGGRLVARWRRRRSSSLAIVATQLPQPADGEPRPLRAVRPDAEARPQGPEQPAAARERVRLPGENVETGKTRTLFFTSGRLQAWETAVDQGLGRPIAGYGFGTEDETFVDRSYLFVSEAVENSFIGVFLQLGVLGVALLVVALALPLAAWWRVRSKLDPERRTARPRARARWSQASCSRCRSPTSPRSAARRPRRSGSRSSSSLRSPSVLRQLVDDHRLRRTPSAERARLDVVHGDATDRSCADRAS